MDQPKEPQPPTSKTTILGLAAGAAAREGSILLDSATPVAGSFSLLAREPEKWIDGSLPDTRPLDAALQEGRERGLRHGGLAGAFAYAGRYRFGFYPQWKITRCGTRPARHNWPPATAGSGVCKLAGLVLHPDLDRAEYLAMVHRTLEYIAAGDIYQACLAYPLRGAFTGDPWQLYLGLRAVSPAPYSAFLNLGDTVLLSSSPELFLKMQDREVETCPIKGTRPRPNSPAAESDMATELLTSAKERAELVMITDLERNDLGRVCQTGSVHVTDLLRLERFARVMHLVSSVRGKLRAEVSHPAAVAACFPGGSITGAPKKRAMEIIAELEPFQRGFYTGAIGCFGFDGNSVFNIAIRTMELHNREAVYPVGAGIVADSDPEAEWEETLAKAGGLLDRGSSGI